MASLSFPLPISTTAPAPSYIPYMFPYAATYHHTFPSPIPTQFDPNRPAAAPIHGDLHNSPFPFFYSPPPAFPYAATYPYPPPTSAYTPEFGFSSNQPIWPPPAPDPIPLTTTSTTYASSSGLSSTAGHVPSVAQLLEVHDPGDASSSSSDRVTDAGQRSSVMGIGFGSPASLLELPDLAPLLELPSPESPVLMEMEVLSASSISTWSSPATTAAKVLSTCSSSLGITGTPDVSLNVFGEMPTPNSVHGTNVVASGYDNCCYGYPNQSKNSCVPGGSTNLREQHVDEVPQSYSLHNLNSQCLFLADGTERRYYALPEDYPLERATPEPVFDVYDVDTNGCSTEFVDVLADLPELQTYEQEQLKSAQPTKCSKANTTANVESMLVQNLQVPTTMQDASSVLKEMLVYDIYEEDNSYLHSMDEQLATPFHKASENGLSERLLKCFSKAPETEQTSACLNIVTDVLDVTLELQQQDDEKISVYLQQLRAPPSHVLVILEQREVWDPGASLPFISRKIQHAAALDGSSGTCFSGCKCLPFCIPKIYVYWESEIGMTTYFSWDLGFLKIKDWMLDKYTVQHHVQFVQQRTELLILISEACIQYYAQNGANSELQGISLLLQRATHSSQDNYLRSLQYQAEYYQVSCLWNLSVSSIKRVQWDPGVKVSLYCWLDTLTVLSEIITPLFCTHIPELARCQNQVISASYVWDPGTMSLQYKSIWLPNGSEFRDGKLAYMPQSPTINSSEFLRHIFTDLSRWLSSFENRVKLQWNPGIAFVYQQDVQKIYNTKNLLSSENYLQIWEIDIIFITFLPP